MTEKKHETLVYRLVEMLRKLNAGETLNPHDLAEEFKVNVRTIQRDLHTRLNYINLKRVENGGYKMDSSFLGKLSTRDVKNFACLAGINGLFPTLSEDFLREVFDQRMQNAVLIRGQHYEDISHRKEDFRTIENAISQHHHLNFTYTRHNESKEFTQIEPYKLLNHKGIWYLIAHNGEMIKTFSLTRMGKPYLLDSHFEPRLEVEKRLAEDDGIWFGNDRKEVVMEVSPDVAGFFRRRKLIANQTIVKELEDGGLIISARISHEKQVLPVVRYWIPHIRIINPTSLQKTLEEELQAYLAL